MAKYSESFINALLEEAIDQTMIARHLGPCAEGFEAASEATILANKALDKANDCGENAIVLVDKARAIRERAELTAMYLDIQKSTIGDAIEEVEVLFFNSFDN